MSIPLPSVRSCVTGAVFLLAGMAVGSLSTSSKAAARRHAQGDFLQEANALTQAQTQGWEAIRGDYGEGTPEYAAARAAWRKASEISLRDLYARHGKMPHAVSYSDR